MKKIIMILTCFLMVISSSFAGSLVYEQSRVISDRALDDLGNIRQTDLIGVFSESNSTKETLGNRTGDLKIDFPQMQKETYFYFDNTVENATIYITYSQQSDESGIIATTQELTLEELGTYYFKLEPNYEKEPILLLIEVPTSMTTQFYIQESHPKGMSFVFETFVSGINEIITINISLWRLGYYLIIGAIIFRVVAGIITTAIMIFDWAVELRDKKHQVMKGKNIESKK